MLPAAVTLAAELIKSIKEDNKSEITSIGRSFVLQALLFKKVRHLRDGEKIRPDDLRNLAPAGDDLREF